MPHTDFTLDGVRLPSVTEILGIVDKPFLRFWYGKNGMEHCERVKKESGELGSRLHDYIAMFLSDEKALPGLNSTREYEMSKEFVAWAVANKFKPIAIEKAVLSKKHGFHGTFDAIGTMNDSDELVVCDWKTSSKIEDLYGCQLAAYAAAYHEETGKFVNKGLIVRLDKKADARKLIETREFDNLNPYLDVFLACKKVFDFQNPTYATKVKRHKKS